MSDTVHDRLLIRTVQHAISLRQWNSLTIAKRRELIAVIKSGLSDREIYSRYIAIKKEPICPLSTTNADVKVIAETSISRRR